MKPWKRYQKRIYPIIQALRRERERQRLRRDVLAEMIGYHWATVGRWERGECHPSLQVLHDWSEALGVELGVFPTVTIGKQPAQLASKSVAH